jgi:hypothetical protein
VLSFQDGLSSQGHHNRVLDIVIQGIGVGDDFKGKMRRPSDHVSEFLFHVTVIAPVGTPELVDTVIHLDFFKIQHGPGTSFLFKTVCSTACECPSATSPHQKILNLWLRTIKFSTDGTMTGHVRASD